MRATGENSTLGAITEPSRRVFTAGLAAAFAGPGLAHAQSGERAEIGRLEAALRQAETRRDLFEIAKARVNLAIRLRGAFFGQTPADWARARAAAGQRRSRGRPSLAGGVGPVAALPRGDDAGGAPSPQNGGACARVARRR